ncbi:hypothetical protein Tco_0416910 [Tanacetum coccineum]
MKKVDRGSTMINHTQAEAMGMLPNVLCQVGVTTLIAKFLILDIPIDRDSPIVVGRGFLRTIGGIVNTPERLFSTFDGFCHQTFRAARSDFMRNAKSDSDDEEDYQIKRNKFGAPIYGPKPAPYLNCNDLDERSLAIQTTMGTHDDDAGSSRSKCSRQHETMEEVLLPQIHHDFLLWEGCHRDAKSRMGCDEEIDDMLKIRLREGESDEEIFTSLQTKKIIKFKVGGRVHSLTLLEFSRRSGLYHADEMEEDGFNRTTGYDKIQKNDLWILSMFDARHQNGVLTEDVVRSLSAPIYCRDLDMITLRDLIDSDGKLIPEDPQPGVPRVGIRRTYKEPSIAEFGMIGKG